MPKYVSIEETREINLPHSNWIPGIARSGFGEIIGEKVAGEIDMYDLMKAALRQRPEYIIVGEIRGREAYVLFQAMATGHTTYSTVHADSAKSVIHRLEGKPINIPRVMFQALDIILLQSNITIKDKNVRRCKQIVEIIDIDNLTNEILSNEVFSWDPAEDKFIYSGKSYIIERIRQKLDLTKEEMVNEINRRKEILEWMKKNNIRLFKHVAQIVTSYIENPEDLLDDLKNNKFKFNQDDSNISLKKIKDESIKEIEINNTINNKKSISSFFSKKNKEKKSEKKFSKKVKFLQFKKNRI